MRKYHNHPIIISYCGGGRADNMERERQCPFIKRATNDYDSSEEKKVFYVHAPPYTLSSKDVGCLSHADAAGHQKIANKIIPSIEEILKEQNII